MKANNLARRAMRRWTILVFLAAILAFWGTLSYPFLHDDLWIIEQNPVVQNNGPLLDLFRKDYWGMRVDEPARDRLFRPLTTLTLIANHALGENDPWGYRALNILLHALVSLLLLRLGLCLGLRPEAAATVALLFAVHPVHTEAVNAVVGRSDLLAAAGLLGGAIQALSERRVGGGAWGRSPEKKKKEATAKNLKEMNRLAVFIGLWFALALFSKESGVAFLLWAVLWVAWCRWPAAEWFTMDREGLGRAAVAAGVVLGLYLVMRYGALGMWSRPAPPSILDNPLAHEGFAGRIAGGLGVLGRYLGLLVYPRPLTIDYSYAQILPWSRASLAWGSLGCFFIAAWGWAAWRWRSGRPEVAFGLALFLAGYAPASNLAVPIGTIMAERLIYIPSAGFFIAFTPALADYLVFRGRRVFIGVLAAAVLLYGGMSWERNGDWSGYLAIWESAARVSPNSARALRLYGQSLNRKGKFSEAIAPLKKATKILPVYDPAWTELGISLMQSRREKESEAAFKEALRLNPRAPENLLAISDLYLGTGRLREASFYLEKAVSLYPNFVEARFRLGNLYLKQRNIWRAEEEYRAALSAAPGRGDIHHNLALILFDSGDIEGSRRHARRAGQLGIRLRPEFMRLLGFLPQGGRTPKSNAIK